jgi:hypothetical protein
MKNEKYIIIESVTEWKGMKNQVHHYQAVNGSGNVWASTDVEDAKTFATKERAAAYANKHGLKTRIYSTVTKENLVPSELKNQYMVLIKKDDAHRLQYKSLEFIYKKGIDW